MGSPLPGRAVVLGVLTSLVLVSGCGGDDEPRASDDAPPPVDATSDGSDGGDSGSGDATSEPSPGQVGSEECSLNRRDVDLVVRDWTRVQDTVGRGDHGRFTAGLVRRLDRLEGQARECDGAAQFEVFAAEVSELDAQAGGDPDYSAYASTEDAGNDWLRAAGLGDNALLRG